MKINGKFKNNFKQLAIPFKIYAGFECNAKVVKSNDRKNNALYTKIYQAHIPCSFSYKVACVDDKFSKPVLLYKEKNLFNKSIEAILKEYDYCKKMIKKYFHNNLANVCGR